MKTHESNMNQHVQHMIMHIHREKADAELLSGFGGGKRSHRTFQAAGMRPCDVENVSRIQTSERFKKADHDRSGITLTKQSDARPVADFNSVFLAPEDGKILFHIQ